MCLVTDKDQTRGFAERHPLATAITNTPESNTKIKCYALLSLLWSWSKSFYFKLLELETINSKPRVKLLKNCINIPNKSPVYFFAVSYSLSTWSTSEQLDQVIFGEAAVCPSRFSAHPHTLTQEQD